MGGDETATKVLTQDEFSRVLQLKSDGNGSFAAADWNKAEESYRQAIAVFDESHTCVTYDGSERETLVALLSNLSMVHLKQQAFSSAEQVATRCLHLRPGHAKASYRRAMARLQTSKKTPRGDLQRVGWALEDVQNADPGDAKTKLVQRLRAEEKRALKFEKQKQEFRKAFASAVDSGDRTESGPPGSSSSGGGGGGGGDSCCHTNEMGVMS